MAPESSSVLGLTTVSLLNSHLLFQSYLFLLSSDYERSEWREAIQKLQKKGKVLSQTRHCPEGVHGNRASYISKHFYVPYLLFSARAGGI